MQDGQRPVILVVNDTPAIRYATVRVLLKAGFTVLEAENGQEAMAAAPKSSAVLLDLHLPDIDGRDVTRALRASMATAKLPIIHYSAVYLTDADRQASAASGADLFLVSPAPPEILISSIELVLQRTLNR